MGCNGKGNLNHKYKKDHMTISDCPYEMDAWKLAVAGLGKLPDRIKSDKDTIPTTFGRFTILLILKYFFIN